MEPRLNSQDVANLLWSFAKVGYRNAPLLDALGDAVSSSSSSSALPGQAGSGGGCARLGTFRPQELSIVLWSYATLGYNHLGVLQAAMKQLSIRSNQLSPQALANACWAAGRCSTPVKPNNITLVTPDPTLVTPNITLVISGPRAGWPDAGWMGPRGGAAAAMTAPSSAETETGPLPLPGGMKPSSPACRSF